MKRNINIVIVEDQALLRRAFISFLNSVEDFNVIAEASNGKELMDVLMDHDPDVVLLDLRMPIMNGWETLDVIKKRFRRIKVVVLSNTDDISIIGKTAAKGADGFVSKSDDPENLMCAIRDVYLVGKYYNRNVAEALLNYLKENKTETLGRRELSERERQIVKEICTGLSNNLISKKLLISPSTVDFHKQRIYKKTNSKNVLDLFKFALKNRIISME